MPYNKKGCYAVNWAVKNSVHTQNHDISRTIKLAGSWPLAIRTENKKKDCQLVIHTALQNKSPNRQTLFIACVFAPEIYFLIKKKKKSSRSIHLTNVNPLKDNSDMLCRWLFHFINVLQTKRKSEGKIYFSHGISVCFSMGEKKKNQGVRDSFYAINHAGCN